MSEAPDPWDDLLYRALGGFASHYQSRASEPPDSDWDEDLDEEAAAELVRWENSFGLHWPGPDPVELAPLEALWQLPSRMPQHGL